MRLDLKTYVAKEKEYLKNDVIGKHIIKPRLLVLQVGNAKESNSYINGKWNDGEDMGVEVTLVRFAPSQAALRIKKYLLAFMHEFDGIILQEPSGLSEEDRQDILRMISPTKDVDGFKRDSMHHPCTPAGIMEILDVFYKGEGKVVTVVGRGPLVGAPLIPMLVKSGWTVLCANSRTPDLKALTSMSDVVVSATGCRNLIKRDMLKDGAFVIDAGITFDENGKLCGDCDKTMYDDETVLVTTVPGGVGLMTRLMLMKNTIDAWMEGIRESNNRGK